MQEKHVWFGFCVILIGVIVMLGGVASRDSFTVVCGLGISASGGVMSIVSYLALKHQGR